MSALFFRVWMGASPTVACPGARGRLQDGWTSPSVSHSRRRPRDLFQFLSAAQVTAVCRPRDPDFSRRDNRFCNRGGREHEGAQGYGLHGTVGDGEADIWATVNGKCVGLHVTMTDIGICDQDTIRCYGRLRGGAQSFRQPPQDIPCQWTCSACGGQRKNVAFGVGAQINFIVSRTGRLPQRSAPTNPTFRPNRRLNKTTNQQASTAAAVQQFPPPPQQQQADDGDTAGTLHTFAPDYVWFQMGTSTKERGDYNLQGAGQQSQRTG